MFAGKIGPHGGWPGRTEQAGELQRYASNSAINAQAEEQVFIPKGVVITTLATEAWFLLFVLVAGANAAWNWLT